PSLTWLESPAWIDGAINPPVMYLSLQQIHDVQQYWKHLLPAVPNLPPTVPPAPPPPPPPPAVPALPPCTPAPPALLPTPTPDETGIGAALAGPRYRQLEFQPSGSNNADYLVSVTKMYSAVDAGAPTKLGKLKVKKDSSQLTDRFSVTTLTRGEFITRFLKVHDLDAKYAPGPHNGPTFKVYWSGFGTKTAATIVLDDHQYQIVRDALVKINPNKANFRINVEFDVDGMDGYHINANVFKQGLSPDPDNQQALKAACIGDYSLKDTIHGQHILNIRRHWKCAEHKGEHNEPGTCYINSDSVHHKLDNTKLKHWASSIHAGEETIREPPSLFSFGPATARHTVRARGRAGPNAAPQAAPATDRDNATTLLLAALASKMLRSPTLASQSAYVPSSPIRTSCSTDIPSSPPTAPDSELHACLEQLFIDKQVDFRGDVAENALAALDFSLDVIANVPIQRLCEVTNLIEGRARKLQLFCRSWSTALDQKRAR
ncbi:hypothetical protein BT96DRAFT_761906, partial [Gymnopus androsaceus JB14]